MAFKIHQTMSRVHSIKANSFDLFSVVASLETVHVYYQ